MLFYQFYFFQTFRNGNIIDQKMVQWWKEGSQEEELVIRGLREIMFDGQTAVVLLLLLKR